MDRFFFKGVPGGGSYEAPEEPVNKEEQPIEIPSKGTHHEATNERFILVEPAPGSEIRPIPTQEQIRTMESNGGMIKDLISSISEKAKGITEPVSSLRGYGKAKKAAEKVMYILAGTGAGILTAKAIADVATGNYEGLVADGHTPGVIASTITSLATFFSFKKATNS